MLFLVSIAGEVDAIKIYISEKSNPIRRNRACGVVIFCSQIGALIASVSFYITVRFGGEYWRLSFLFGGVLGLVVVAFRHYFQEAELFVKYKQNSQSAPNIAKTWDIIKNYRLLFVTAILISGVIGGMYNFLVIFFPPFLQQAFGEPSLSPQVLSTSLIILYAVTAIISGILADFLREKQILLAITVSICSGLFFYPEIKQPAILIFLLGALSPLYSVPLQILMQFSFPINIRMRMVSLAHSIGSMIFSANTPLLGMLIWKKTGSLELVVIVPFLYLVILLVSTWMLLKIQVKDN
jgi:MFS family permease